MDFYQIKPRPTKNGFIELRPEFMVCRSKDLMIRGKSFYAIWDEERGLWSTDEYDVQRLVDQDLAAYKSELEKKSKEPIVVKWMRDFSSNSWTIFKNYINRLADNSHQLDERLTFLNDTVEKKDYRSKRLPYDFEEGDISAYDEIMAELYDPEERAKLEWAIGCIFSGDSREIQKFEVLYGPAGTGKSTFLQIVQWLFEGYYITFDAKALTSLNNAFSTEVFKSNPLVAIQHDGDLSRIEDNAKLNSIVSHEEMTLNEKYKPSYTSRINCFLFMGTNRPVRITDAKSGIIRRLIDVTPSGRKLPAKKYQALMSQVKFELGAVAYHCLEVYRKLGKNHYMSYKPMSMIYQTDTFFNFVESQFDIFKEQDGISLQQAYAMYKTYCDEALVEFKLPRHKFREELKNYFGHFYDITRIDGRQVRSYYSDFLKEKFSVPELKEDDSPMSLVLDSTHSLLDDVLKDCKAQYASETGKPLLKWDSVKTTLSDLDTTKMHYVMPPYTHIVVDFDLKDKDGKKSPELNLEAASKFPPTYGEFSKGRGIHLHYIYNGDPSKLSRVFSEGIEIKVFTGNSSLRRKLTLCNEVPIAVISSGLPLKGDTMINFKAVETEKQLRSRIEKNLKKEYHPNTKPSVDFIFKILDDAYKSGMHYDVTDLRPKILAFAANSTNNSKYCVDLVNKMQFKSDEPSSSVESMPEDEIVFFDCEVFPNLFLVNWKVQGKSTKCVRMINPTSSDIEKILKFKLVGFNCRRYDNHILYARYIGYNNAQLFDLSQKLVNGSRNALFSEAYSISYTDVYDFSSKKQSLKKWEIELGIHHHELGLPWDQPVPESEWVRVAEYCDDDVIALEKVFEARKEDFVARQILAALSGLTVNDSTQQHAAKIIFGNDPHPQDSFVYTDLSVMFPGYEFKNGVSTYRGEIVGEGGKVYSEPGMYTDVHLLDVESMHPTSIEQLNLFGKYTVRFSELKRARLAIKHKDISLAKSLLNGILAPFIEEGQDLDALAYALKIVINIVYGLTAAKFDNKFRDPRNIDNIVAKRGALFMIDLCHAVRDKGFLVAHIKTDSIKIPNATEDILQFVEQKGREYGYIFDRESVYDRMCLINDAVYIAHVSEGKHAGEWVATGAQFAEPYVFKTLFSHEPIEFRDLCQAKACNTSMYLDMNEGLPEGEHNYVFVGKAGSFCPILPGKGGGELFREKDGKYYSVSGTKGYRWLESEYVQEAGKEADIDMSYFRKLVDESIADISKYGDFEWFVSLDSPNKVHPWTASDQEDDGSVPWELPCGDKKYETCFDCPKFSNDKFHSSCELGYEIQDLIFLKGDNNNVKSKS